MQQRYLLPNPTSINVDIDKELDAKFEPLHSSFQEKWGSHHCDKPGCGSVLGLTIITQFNY